MKSINVKSIFNLEKNQYTIFTPISLPKYLIKEIENFDPEYLEGELILDITICVYMDWINLYAEGSPTLKQIYKPNNILYGKLV